MKEAAYTLQTPGGPRPARAWRPQLIPAGPASLVMVGYPFARLAVAQRLRSDTISSQSYSMPNQTFQHSLSLDPDH